MRKKASRPIKNNSVILDIQDYLRYKNERDYILFLVGITTGYRAGDLVKLKVRDVKQAIKSGEFLIYEQKKFNKGTKIRDKNRKPRSAILIPRVEKELKKYIQDKKDYEFVFTSRKGSNKNIGVQAVSNILKDAGNYFGLDYITSHSMRKTFAYKMYIESDKDIVYVKELLGHSSIEETKLYIGIESEKYRELSKTFNDYVRS